MSRKTKAVICNSDDESDFEFCGSSCESDHYDEQQQQRSCLDQQKLNDSSIKNQQEADKTNINFDVLADLKDFVDEDEDKLDNTFSQMEDYEQNVARASFGDMVNDYERNKLFYQAIQKSVECIRKRKGSSVFALDIGCGTGLLSMMAVRSGADKVLACDTFGPVADVAKKIINKNVMSEKITIVPKQSNLLNLDESPDKPNLLVAELLDTELIGEGCLFAYRDAVKRLTSDDALFVPSKARVYIQLVQSNQLFNHHQFKKSFSMDSNHFVNTPKSANNCFGSHILHDIQMSRLKPGVDFDILSQPQVIFEFEFNKLESLKLNDCKRLRIPLLRKFTEPIVVFSWWDLDMDFEGEIVLSCAPYWARHKTNENEVAWRDHWMQTIYYLPAFAFTDSQLDGFNHQQINDSESLLLDAYHDSFSFWFDLPPDQQQLNTLDSSSECWSCICSLHSHLSRSRLFALNDDRINQTFWRAFNSQIDLKFCHKKSLSFVYFGDESIVPLLLATHEKVFKIYLLCQDNRSHRFYETFLDENEHILPKVELIKNNQFASDISNVELDGIISDLYFKNFGSLLPSLAYYNVFKKYSSLLIKQSLTMFTFPKTIRIKCLLVEFKEYWKSFADVGSDVEGFDLSLYDELIQTARNQVDWTIEPIQGWEYSCSALIEKSMDLFDLDLFYQDDFENEQRKNISIDLSHLSEKLTSKWAEKVAFVIWTDFVLDEGQHVISFGPQNTTLSIGDELTWSKGAQNGVGFLGKKWSVPTLENCSLDVTFTLSLTKQSLSFDINNEIKN